MTATSTAVKGTTAKAKKGARVQLNQRPIVPFGRNDRILLVGEGKFLSSFFLDSLCVGALENNNNNSSMYIIIIIHKKDPKTELINNYARGKEEIKTIPNWIQN